MTVLCSSWLSVSKVYCGVFLWKHSGNIFNPLGPHLWNSIFPPILPPRTCSLPWGHPLSQTTFSCYLRSADSTTKPDESPRWKVILLVSEFPFPDLPAEVLLSPLDDLCVSIWWFVRDLVASDVQSSLRFGTCFLQPLVLEQQKFLIQHPVSCLYKNMDTHSMHINLYGSEPNSHRSSWTVGVGLGWNG